MVQVINASIIRKNSAFLKRQRGIPKHFSTEPFNLARLNSIRYNGLVNTKAVDVQPAKAGKGVQLTIKKKSAINKPVHAKAIVTLTKDSRKVLKSVGNSVLHYKPSYAKLAQRRASQILRTQKKIKGKGAKKNKAE